MSFRLKVILQTPTHTHSDTQRRDSVTRTTKDRSFTQDEITLMLFDCDFSVISSSTHQYRLDVRWTSASASAVCAAGFYLITSLLPSSPHSHGTGTPLTARQQKLHSSPPVPEEFIPFPSIPVQFRTSVFTHIPVERPFHAHTFPQNFVSILIPSRRVQHQVLVRIWDSAVGGFSQSCGGTPPLSFAKCCLLPNPSLSTLHP